MVPKSKQIEGEENPFLPPPVDLDKISLDDKDYLIADTKCDFKFTYLQSWIKEVFLDQSDEIRLWESNLPLYLFPRFTISLISPSSAKPTIFPSKEPLYRRSGKFSSSSHLKPSNK
jgi:hypothetical protein